MRRVRSLLALCAVVAVVLFAVPAERAAAQTGSATPVNIPDPVLRARLEGILGKSSGATITRAEMATLGSGGGRTLDLARSQANQNNPALAIKDLTGLEYATSPWIVDLRRNEILDLSPLAGLTQLRNLILSQNGRLSDLRPLAGLTTLTELNLERNLISDLTPLAGLTALDDLILDQNRISDITPLAGLTALTDLTLHNNLITDITPLAGLTALENLILEYNQITNIAPLRDMTALKNLRLEGNERLRDVTVVTRLTALRVLELDGTSVRDLQPLVDNAGLGSGDILYLRNVPDLNEDAAGHIATLRGRGITVFTNPGGLPLTADRTVRGVRVAPGIRRLTVTWNRVTTATGFAPTGYTVQWKFGSQYFFTINFTPPRHQHVIGLDTTSYTIPNLTPGVQYLVRVRPYPRSSGYPSAAVSGVPLADRHPSFAPNTFPAQRYPVGDEIEPVTLPAARSGDPPLAYTLAPEPDLPAGLSFDATTRTLTGTPADLQDETTYTLTATDSDGDTATLTFSIAIVPDLWPLFDQPVADAPDGNCDYVENVPARPWVLPRAVGGNGTLRYALAPALPRGLSYTAPPTPAAGGGTIAGTPTEAWPETAYTLTATDMDGDATDPPWIFVLCVAADSVPTFDGVAMGGLDLTVGSTRAILLPAARSGNPPLAYTLAPEPALPAGLSFDAPQRTIRGTPTAAMPETSYALTATDLDGDVTDPPLRFPLIVSSTPLRVTLEDAAAAEGAPVRFSVKLSRASVEPLTLTWTTGTAGSATPGEDYRAEAAGALTVPAGETEATLVVPTLEDRQVEPAETFSVAAALPASSPGSLARSEATGTINDNDAAAARKRSLGMVLAGVGRTLAADTVDVIGARFGQPTPEASAVLGGEELTPRNAARAGRWRHAAGAAYGVARALGLEVGMPWAGGVGASGAADGAGWSTLTRAVSTAAWDAPHMLDGGSGPDDGGRRASSAAFREAWGGAASAPGSAGYDGLAQLGFDRAHAASPRMRTDALRWRRPVGFRRVAAGEMLTRSRFDVPLGDRDAATGASDWTLWGRGTASGFNGKPKDDFSMDGDLYSGYLGLDYRVRPDVLLGLAVAHSRGDVDYASAGITEGALDVELTSVLPYAHWSPRPGLGVWSLLGVGWGRAELRDEAGTVKPDLEMLMAAGGVRQELLQWRRIDLALKADTFLTELETDRGNDLPKTAGDAQRVRLLLEGRTAWTVSDESHVTPVLELGGRWDGGKAETGLGAELGGRLEYAHTRLGVGLEAGGRYLLAHQKSAFDEWGASLTLRLDPGVAGRGLWLTFAPVWGAESSKVAQMWDGADVLRTGAGSDADAPGPSPARLDLDLGYGWVTHEGAGLLTTWGGVGMAGPDTRDYRLGVTSAVGDCVDLSMEGARETRFGGAAAHEIMLSGSVCW